MTEMLFNVVDYRRTDQVLTILFGPIRYRVTIFQRYFHLYPLQCTDHLDRDVLHILLSNFFFQPQLQAILHRQMLSTIEVYQVQEAIAITKQKNYITVTVRNGEKRKRNPSSLHMNILNFPIGE